MFAVPGWSVASSTLKTQSLAAPKSDAAAAAPKPASTPKAAPKAAEKATENAAEQEVEPPAEGKSKKRKRGPKTAAPDSLKEEPKDKPLEAPKAAQNVNVTSANVADLWETVIEGKPKVPGKTNAEKHAEKRQKIRDKKAEEKRTGEGRKDGDKKTDEVDGSDDEEAGSDGPEVKRKKKGKTLKEKKREMKAKALGLPVPIHTSSISTGPKAKDGKKTQPTKADSTSAESSKAVAQPSKPAAPLLTPLQASMRQKLISARFRHLNQTLYTTPSANSLELFEQNPEMFDEYHEGFRRQVEVWPANPVDGYIELIQRRALIKAPKRGNPSQQTKVQTDSSTLSSLPLPRTDGFSHIADLGCGDAALSQGLQKSARKLHLKISSFDLQSPSPLVTRADIAALPLADDSVDVAIFCLALMGTNWIDFVEEAFRVLHWKGELWIAEIKSRFGRASGPGARVEHSVGNRKRAAPVDKKKKAAADEGANEALLEQVVDADDTPTGRQTDTDVSAFIEVLRKRGFVLQAAANPNMMDVSTSASGAGGHKGDPAIELGNKMFVKMFFVKGLAATKGKGVREKDLEKLENGKGGEGRFEANKGSWVKKKGKFLDGDDGKDGDGEDENAVLKPCVYKLR